jgi:hypothetical protein
MADNGRKKGDSALLTALAAGATAREAAARAGLSERTIYRRMEDPEFRRRVTEARATMVESALGKVADGMSDAAAKLRELLAAQSEAVRLGAARSLLELGIRLRESVELEQRLAAMEERLQESERHESTYAAGAH